MIARNKAQPEYTDYVSYAELVSMFNACSSIVLGSSWNYRIYSTNVHLVLEIALKKMAIHYGIPVSTTQHKVGSLLHKLSLKDLVIQELTNRLTISDELSLLQRFPYDELRFNSYISEKLISVELLSSVTQIVLRRLEHIDSVRRSKNKGRRKSNLKR